jgi:ribonuclease HI
MDNEMNNAKHVVLYIDGSSKPNPGPHGFGLHGFIYTDEEIGKQSKARPKIKTIDNKSMLYNITTQGYIESPLFNKDLHTLVEPKQFILGYKSFKGDGSNNVAEVKAFIDMIIYIVMEMEIDDLKSITFNTDSMYLLNIINNIKNNPNWQDKAEKNRELWFSVDQVLKIIQDNDLKLMINKVKGHSTAIGNNVSDRMALLGRIEASRNNKEELSVKVIDDSKFWGPEPYRHPLLKHSRVFFMSNKDNIVDGRYSYSVLNVKTDVEPGKTTAMALYGLVNVKNTEPLLQTTKESFDRYLGTLSVVSAVDTNILYQPLTYRYLETFKEKVIVGDKKGRKAIRVLGEDKVCSEIYPSGLATNALDKIQSLNIILEDYKADKPNMEYVDITNMFFEKDKKDRDIMYVPMSTKYLEYDCDGVKVILFFGKDLPERNTIKRLEKKDTKIILVLNKKKNNGLIVIEYFVIIETPQDDEISIWCNFNSSLAYQTKPKKKK